MKYRRKGWGTYILDSSLITEFGDLFMNGKKIGKLEPNYCSEEEVAQLVLTGISLDEFEEVKDGDSRENN